MNWVDTLLPAINHALKERARREHRRKMEEARRGHQKKKIGRPRKS
jgi:hypothetical protein